MPKRQKGMLPICVRELVRNYRPSEQMQSANSDLWNHSSYEPCKKSFGFQLHRYQNRSSFQPTASMSNQGYGLWLSCYSKSSYPMSKNAFVHFCTGLCYYRHHWYLRLHWQYLMCKIGIQDQIGCDSSSLPTVPIFCQNLSENTCWHWHGPYDAG